MTSVFKKPKIEISIYMRLIWFITIYDSNSKYILYCKIGVLYQVAGFVVDINGEDIGYEVI